MTSSEHRIRFAFRLALYYHLFHRAWDPAMDKNIPIKMLVDSLIENSNILMCAIVEERSGSTLIKIRVGNNNGDQTGEDGGVTQNSNVYFKRKNDKQVKRDLSRVQKHNCPKPVHMMSTRSRTDIEKPRSTSPMRESDPTYSQVASPESIINSPATPNCLSLSDQSPVQPYQNTQLSVDSSEEHDEEPCLNNSVSDSASVGSDSQLESSEEMPSEMPSEETDFSDRNASAASHVETKPKHNKRNVSASGSSSSFLDFLMTERGEQYFCSEIRKAVKMGCNDSHIDDT